MAVKPREKLDSVASGALDPKKLAHFLKMFQHAEIYLPTSADVISCCKDIAVWLGGLMVPAGEESQYVDLLTQLQMSVANIISAANPKVRKDIINSMRNLIYPMISNHTSAPSQGMCILLNVLQAEAAEWMVEEGDSAGTTGTNDLKTMMAYLLRLLYMFDCMPVYNDIVMVFIKQLEEKQRWDVLMEVSLVELTNVFHALLGPRDIRANVAPVLFHMIGSLRQHPLIIDKISDNLEYVLETLAWDSSQLSRQLLQTIVDITSALIQEQGHTDKEKYAAIKATLDAHMTSNSCSYLQLEPWKAVAVSGPDYQTRPKNGLRNLDNMCYFNSVMQALLLNKTFSRHVIMHMHSAPVWSNVCKLFTRMLYANGPVLDITEFFKKLKPPEFTDGHQHDCSELLMHLMDSLSAVELQIMVTAKADHRQPIDRPSGSSSGQSSSSVVDMSTGESSEQAQVSSADIPESSKSASSSSGTKRNLEQTHDTVAQKKRCFRSDSETFIQATFGGCTLTSITCLLCGSDSKRLDTFREIQLAIPDKQDMVKDEYTVQFLVNHYYKTELLSGDNAYHCSSCNQLRSAEKSIYLTDTPKYLLIVLKRFNYNPKMQTHTKLMHKVILNRLLYLPLVGGPAAQSTFRLYATVIHAGMHVDMGHYYTLAEDNGQWFRYNDELVESVDEKELLRLNTTNDTPYLLFYRRLDVEEVAQPEISELPEPVLTSIRMYDKQQANRLRHGTRSSTGHATVRPVYT